MKSEHQFCRVELSGARAEAKRAGIKVPGGLTALNQTKNQWFIESKKADIRQVHKGCCATSAKAHYINSLIDSPTRLVGISLQAREIPTLFAALRYWQASGHPAMYPAHFSEFEPLSGDDIDSLCERINIPE